jgi:ADP-ribose pyrophosphatase YjhB (NUDIX family)
MTDELGATTVLIAFCAANCPGSHRMPEARRAARLIVLDSSSRILLFRYVDADGRAYWATPGGGLEDGETPEQAAKREASEELGATVASVHELWTGKAEFRLGQRPVLQTETFFLLDCGPLVPGRDVEQAHQAERIKESRWWTLADIERSDELIFPDDFATRLRETVPRLLSGWMGHDSLR